jgi:beta-N-acetylhexosaminidase
MSYGPVWVDLQGPSILREEIPILRHKNTGGVLLFTKNFLDLAQLKTLVKNIRSYAEKPVIIGVDHEGGRIWRFKDGFTCPPSAKHFGNLYEVDPDTATQALVSAGSTVARELLECDIDLTFAPVLDINHGVSDVIGDRAYHSDPNIVAECARAFIIGLKQYGMGAIGKHFPGHGGCSMDSHFVMAEDKRSFAELQTCDLIPFTKLHTLLTGVMPAHVLYSAVDPDITGFSKFWLQDVLRQQIGFAGAIISDCLSMQGSGFNSQMVQGAERALNAGCDMVIATQQTREYLLHVLDNLNWDMQQVQQQRIRNLAAVKQVDPELSAI